MTYRIGAFSRAVRISEHTLRYYEKEGLIVPHRTSSNIRYYTEDDRLWTEFILHMKETGMSLQDLKRYSELLRTGDTGVEELTELLIQHRKKVEDKLSTFQRNLQLLNKKIAFYQGELQENESKDLFTIFIQEKRSDRD